MTERNQKILGIAIGLIIFIIFFLKLENTFYLNYRGSIVMNFFFDFLYNFIYGEVTFSDAVSKSFRINYYTQNIWNFLAILYWILVFRYRGDIGLYTIKLIKIIDKK